jgi:hypothetical protein
VYSKRAIRARREPLFVWRAARQSSARDMRMMRAAHALLTKVPRAE